MSKFLKLVIYIVLVILCIALFQNCGRNNQFPKSSGKLLSSSSTAKVTLEWAESGAVTFDTTVPLVALFKPIVIRNKGPGSAINLTFTTEGNTAFGVDSSSCNNIPSNGSCTINAKFRPQAFGNFNGVIKVKLAGKTLLQKSFAGAARPRMYEYGQDILNPLDTSFARNITQEYLNTRMAGKPFHGITIRTHEFWLLMSKSHQHTFAQFSDRLNVLKSLNFGQFKENYLAVGAHNMVGGQAIPDWFELAPNGSDDVWQKGPINNFKVMAQVAKAAGFRGIMIDPEDYHEWGSDLALWNYNTRPLRGQHSFQEYVVKVRERGKQMMMAMNSVFPGITILTYACYDPFYSGGGYELLAAFCDGLILGADENTAIHVISENGFMANDAASVKNVIDVIKQRSQPSANPLSITADSAKIAKHLRAGIGLWYTGQGNTQWREMIQTAVQHTEGYVWIYTENSGWGGSPQYQWWPNCTIPGDIYQTTLNAFNSMN